MDIGASQLSVLIKKNVLPSDKLGNDLGTNFLDYSEWMTNDFIIDADLDSLPSATPKPEAPQVVQWGPQEGSENALISVILERTPVLAKGQMKVVFGNLVLDTISQGHAQEDPPSPWITLVARAPPLKDIQAGSDGQLPVSISHVDAHQLVTGTWVIGAFTYLSSPILSYGERKRTASPTLADEYPHKKVYSTTPSNDDCQQLLHLLAPFDDPLQQDGRPSLDMSSWLSSSTPQHFDALRASMYPSPKADKMYAARSSNLYVNTPSYINTTDSVSSASSFNMPTPQQQTQAYFNHAKKSTMPMTPTSSSAAASTPTYGSMTIPTNYNGLSNTSHPSPHSFYGYGPPNPPSISSSAATNPSAAQVTSNIPMNSINPLAGILNKANLKICGDLMVMTVNWTPYEWTCGRRLVRFWRRQNTSNLENSQQVECGFEPIDYYVHQQQMRQLQLQQQASQATSPHHATQQPPAPRPPVDHQVMTTTDNGNNQTTYLVVSCIYWRERNDYFITSVDCIYLLEGLIGVQFTVEEKNRIRRNLEGFRPLTVSKCKADCADFFKLIMGFPHPKPRNIEKDVKVFAWKTLPHALRKIIRKYTPHYTNPSVASAAAASAAASQSLLSPTKGYPSSTMTNQHLPQHPPPPSAISTEDPMLLQQPPSFLYF